MSDAQENQLECRIVRALDGELSAPQRQELDRELIRDPASRELMEEYRRLDRMSASALRAALGRADELPRLALQPRRGVRPRPWRWPSIVLTAAAATLLSVGAWMLLGQGFWYPSAHTVGSVSPQQTGQRGPGAAEPSARATGVVGPGAKVAAGTARPAAGKVPMMYDMADPSPILDAPRQGDRIINRRFFGVFDEAKGELYLIEVDRVRTRIDTVWLDW